MISIAMCTYNGSKYIEEQLNSIIQQTIQPDEIVICDDCSTDDTVNIIKNKLKSWKGNWKLIVNTENLGYKKNFQKAISLTLGDIVFLSDQDDVWNLEKISQMKNVFDKQANTAMAFHDAELVDAKLHMLYPSFWKILDFDYHKFIDKNYDMLLCHNVVQGSACAFRRQVFDLARPFPESAVHDEWLVMVAIRLGNVYPIPKTLMKYRQDNNVLGALPPTVLERVKHYTTAVKHVVNKNYNELIRRENIYHTYIERFSKDSDLKCKFSYLNYGNFLKMRLHCIQSGEISFFKYISLYFYTYVRKSWAVKEMLKDFLAILFYKKC